MEEILARHWQPNVQVFVVWQPMLATDWMAPTTGALRRLPDRRARHYWDKEHVLAKRLARDARPPQPVQSCCDQDGILWDLAAVYPKGVRWDDALPPAAVFDGPVYEVTEQIARAVSASP